MLLDQLNPWGQDPTPPGSASPRVGLPRSSAKQNYAFASFSGKRGLPLDQFLGGKPKIGFAEGWVGKPNDLIVFQLVTRHERGGSRGFFFF
jgi:hypothetical protein